MSAKTLTGQLQLAKEKAAVDSNSEPLTVSQFCELRSTIEFTPKNHKELFELAKQSFFDLKLELEDGDESVAAILKRVKKEPDIRKYISNEFIKSSYGKYSIEQEYELSDETKPDIRFQGMGFDSPVPVELKLADNCTGNKLYDRIENQLCRDYLRDIKSANGIFVLVYRGSKTYWEIPNSDVKADFCELLILLQKFWYTISPNYPNIDNIQVIGIDLTKRFENKKK